MHHLQRSNSTSVRRYGRKKLESVTAMEAVMRAQSTWEKPADGGDDGGNGGNGALLPSSRAAELNFLRNLHGTAK